MFIWDRKWTASVREQVETQHIWIEFITNYSQNHSDEIRENEFANAKLLSDKRCVYLLNTVSSTLMIFQTKIFVLCIIKAAWSESLADKVFRG